MASSLYSKEKMILVHLTLFQLLNCKMTQKYQNCAHFPPPLIFAGIDLRSARHFKTNG